MNEVASLQVLPPAKWELILMDTLWDKMAPKVLDIFVVAEQGKSPGCVYVMFLSLPLYISCILTTQ